MGLRVSLLDVTAAASTVFDNQQVSENTVNQSFTLGETNGDSLNTLVGELTGSLTAGHDYLLNYSYFVLILVGNPPDAGATAVGSLDFEITPCAATCAADLNGDGVVNAADLAELLAAWGVCPE